MGKKITIGIIAHVDSGKTTLSEAMLYQSGQLRSFGRVDKGESFLDGDVLERKRGITIYSKMARLSYGDTEFVLLDTPGHSDFGAEMERTLQVLDYAVLLISATDNLSGRPKTLWRLLAEYNIPTFIFFNKMDQEGVDKKALINAAAKELSDNIVEFSASIIGSGINAHKEDKSNADENNGSDNIYEQIAMCEESAMEEFLSEGVVSTETIAELIADRKLFPAFFGSALKMEQTEELLVGLDRYTLEVDYPEEFGARVYKILRSETGSRLTVMKITGGTLKTRDVILDGDEEIKAGNIRLYSGDKYSNATEVKAGEICAVEGLSKVLAGEGLGFEKGKVLPLLIPVLTFAVAFPDGDDPVKVLPNFKMLEEEIPELSVSYSEEKKEISVQVMGQIQLEILTHTLMERFSINATFGTGRVLYKETIKSPAIGVGHFEPLRHYAEVHLLLEPLPLGSGLAFDSNVSVDLLAKNWQRLILTHLAERTHRGVLTRAPITDMKITLIAGRAHPKHTEGGDFRQAVYRAVRQGLMMAESVLLEPCYSFTMSIPTDAVGRALTDLDRMHATFNAPDMDAASGMSVISGRVSVREFADYPRELASYTKGTGTVDIAPDGYIVCGEQERIVDEIGYNPIADLRNTPDSVFCAHGSGYVVPFDEVYGMAHIPVGTLDLSDGNTDIYQSANDELADSETVRARAKRMSESHRKSVLDTWIGVDEVDAIINSIAYAGKDTKPVRHFKKKYSNVATTVEYGKKTSGNNKVMSTNIARPLGSVTLENTEYILIDGYNVIYAWERLRELANVNMDSAKDALLDEMCNYQAIKGCELIVVFDAYKVKGHGTEYLDFNNIHVVYTKEAQTADQYIERFAHEHSKKHRITVVTSDGIEQVIILGQGCGLVSSREFEKLVENNSNLLREKFGVK